jgi:hypothetical protein
MPKHDAKIQLTEEGQDAILGHATATVVYVIDGMFVVA